METQQIHVSKGYNGQHIVRISRMFGEYAESRAYAADASLHTAQAIASTLRNDVRRHGVDVIDFTLYPVVTAKTGRRGTRYWA